MSGLILFLADASDSLKPIELSLDATVSDLLVEAGEARHRWKRLVLSFNGTELKDLQPEALLADIGLGQEQVVRLRLDVEELVETVNDMLSRSGCGGTHSHLYVAENGRIHMGIYFITSNLGKAPGRVLIDAEMYDEFRNLADMGVICLQQDISDYDGGYDSYIDYNVDKVPKDFLIYLVQNEVVLPKYCDGRELYETDSKFERVEKLAILIHAGVKFYAPRSVEERESIKRTILHHTDITAEEFDRAFE